MDLPSIMRQLFSLDPSQAPAGLPGGGIGSAPAAPAAPVARDPIVDDSPQGKVLATLRDRSAANVKPVRGPFGIPTGPLPDVKGKSKGSAFATGLAAGMNNAQNATALDNKSATDQAATNMKTMAALFSAQEQTRANDIREKNALALQNYYKGIVENGRLKANATSPKDVAANEHTIEMTKRSAATRFGLNSPQLAKDLSSPIPSVKKAAEDEYRRRRDGYTDWEKSFNARVGAGADPVNAAVGAHIKTGTDGVTPPDAPAAPAGGPAPAPASNPAPAAAKPVPAAPAAAAAPAAPAPETWQPIRNTKDGSMWLFNPGTGEKKPMPGQPAAAPAAPSFPDPAGLGPDPAAPAPAAPDDDEE